MHSLAYIMHLVRKKPYQKTKYEVQNLIVIVAVMIICSNELRSLQHSSVLNRNNLYRFLHLRTAKINLHYQIIELLAQSSGQVGNSGTEDVISNQEKGKAEGTPGFRIYVNGRSTAMSEVIKDFGDESGVGKGEMS
ncbi:hypothetical protein LXL04_029166 [Taraxacum kok-saghyz]